MRFSTAALFAVPLLVAPAEAQNHNPIQIMHWPPAVEVRGSLGTGSGRLMMRIPSDAAGGATLIEGMRFTFQSWSSNPPQPMVAEIFPDNGAGMPNVLAPLAVVPLTFTGNPSGAPAVWRYTVDLGTPLQPPCNGDLYFSVWLAPCTPPCAYPLTLQGVPQATSASLPPGFSGELPRGLVNPNVNLAWEEVGGVVQELPGELSMEITALYEQPTLQPFADVPAFTYNGVTLGPSSRDVGQAGRYPDVNDVLGVGRFDDIGWKAYASSFRGTGAIGLLYLARSSAPAAGIGCPGLPPFGNLWLDPTDALFQLGPLMQTVENNGEFDWGTLPLTPYLRQVLPGSQLIAQAVIFTPGRARLSNAAVQFY